MSNTNFETINFYNIDLRERETTIVITPRYEKAKITTSDNCIWTKIKKKLTEDPTAWSLDNVDYDNGTYYSVTVSAPASCISFIGDRKSTKSNNPEYKDIVITDIGWQDRETVINFGYNDKNMIIYTTNNATLTKIKRLNNRMPGSYQFLELATSEGHIREVKIEAPKKLLSFRRQFIGKKPDEEEEID